MGCIKLFSSGKTSNNYQEVRVSEFDPNPAVFHILRFYEFNGHIAVEINYPNCNTYEGNKIIVFLDTTIEQLRKLKEIDPHFTEEDKIKPFARFEPTFWGWFFACLITRNVRKSKS